MFIEEYSLRASSESLSRGPNEDSTDDNECGSFSGFSFESKNFSVLKVKPSYKRDYFEILKVFVLKSFGHLCSNSFFYITSLCLNYSASSYDLQVLGKALFIVSML